MPPLKKILIVDDEADIVALLKELLAEYDIITASDGKAALEQAMNAKPDLIISDIQMPRMTGLEMLTELRKKGYAIPVIFVTAFSDIQKVRVAWKLGAFDFIDKPLDFTALSALIQKAFEFGQVVQNILPDTIPPANITLSLPWTLFQGIVRSAAAANLSVEQWLEKHVQSK